MKTRDEMVYDFMLALAPTISTDDMEQGLDEPEILDHCADCVLGMAQTLARKYLESL
jgi:hypothetical protein